jgi:hypothetical protein
MTSPHVPPAKSAGKIEPNGARIFTAIPTRRGEELRIAFSQFKNQTYLAIRIWYADDAGEMRPSAKGVNVRVEHLPAIAETIGQALDAARADGLV